MAKGDNGAISAIGATKNHGKVDRKRGLGGGVSLAYHPQVPPLFDYNSKVLPHLTDQQRTVSVFS